MLNSEIKKYIFLKKNNEKKDQGQLELISTLQP